VTFENSTNEPLIESSETVVHLIGGCQEMEFLGKVDTESRSTGYRDAQAIEESTAVGSPR